MTRTFRTPVSNGRQQGRVLRILLVALAAVAMLAALLLAGVTWGPHLARERIARLVGESIGRTVSIGRIDVSPFAGRVVISGVEVASAAGGGAPLLAVERAAVTVEPRSLVARAPRLLDLRIDAPVVTLARVAPDRLDVHDIVERLRAQPSDPDAPRARWRIERAVIDRGRVSFDDRVAGKLTRIDAMAVELASLGTRDADLAQPATLQARFDLDGRPATARAAATPFADDPSAELKVTLDATPIVPWLAYVPLPPDLRPTAGTLTTALEATLKPRAASRRLRIEGTLALDEAAIRDAAGRDRVLLPALHLRLAPSLPLDGVLHLAEVRIQGAAVALGRGADGALDWPQRARGGDAATTRAAAPSPAPSPAPSAPSSAPPGTPSSAAPPMSLRIDRLAIGDARLAYDDAALRAPLALRVAPLAVTGDAIEIPDLRRAAEARGTLRLDATIDEGARVGADVVLDGAAGRARLDLAGVDIARYAPLAGPALKARIARGALDARAAIAWDVGTAAWSLADGALELGELQVEHDGRMPLVLGRMSVGEVALDSVARRVAIGRLAVDGASVALRRDRAGRIDVLDWYVPEPPATAEPATVPASAVPASAVPASAVPASAVPASAVPASAVPASAAAAEPAATDVAAAAWELNVAQVSLAGIEIDYDDAAIPRDRRLPKVTLAAKASDLTLDPTRPVPFEASVALADGSRVASAGSIRPRPLRLDTRVRLQRFTLTHFDPYIAPFINLSIARGQLWGAGRLALDEEADGLRIGFDGELSANEVRAIDKVSSDDFLRFGALAMPSVKVDWRTARIDESLVEIGTVAFVDFYSRVILGADGRLNLSQVMVDRGTAPRSLTQAPDASTTGTAAPRRNRAAPADDGARDITQGELGGTRDGAAARGSARAASAAARPGPTVRVGTVRIASGNVDFTDLFIRPNYSANLTRLVGSIDAIASDRDEPSDVVISGRVDNDTPLEITGKINPLAPARFVDLRAVARGFDLPKLSAYSGRWAGYAIEKGKLTADVRYTIEGDQLEASNRLVINQLTFGEKVQSADALDLPVQLAVSLLKDRDGNIELDLPISGSISDPQFSVSSLIGKALGNAFVRIVASPFAFLSSIAGGTTGELSHLAFAAGGTALDDEARRRLDALARALTDRPALSLDIAGFADPKADREAMQRDRLDQSLRSAKLAAMKRANPTAELPALNELSLDDTERVQLMERLWRDAKLDAGGVALPAPQDLERLLLARTDVAVEDVRSIAQRRAQAARDYLHGERGIANERLYLLSPRLAEPGGALPPQRAEFAIK